MYAYECVKVTDLINKMFDSVKREGDSIIFTNADEEYRLEHTQDCCESVYIDDLCGDLKDLENVPIFMAEESTEDVPPDQSGYGEYCGYTFYRFWTSKGPVVIRWQGSSNGYYGIGVNCTRYRPN
jgi:hypothetical protein